MGNLRARSGSRLGSYELGERLGAGGMAEVYVASRVGPRGFNKRFAIKLILPQLAQDPRFVAMFCDEARICAALNHPNVVQVTDFGESDGKLFMAMEYVDGVSCAKLLRAVAARGDRFPLGAALFIAHEVLKALSFAHEACDEQGRALRIVHRDVSPGNILIGRAGEVKLTDFGIVRSSFIDRRTYPGELKGKMGYMSPEQVIGTDLDARSDLFTVGIVLAEMLVCRPLFPGRNELDVLSRIFEADLRVLDRYGSHLPAELLTTLRTALARDPKQRFQSARDFADALRSIAIRAGLGLSDGDLLPWLANLGILAAHSGTREAVVAPTSLRPSVPSGRPSLTTLNARPPRPPPMPLLQTEPPPSPGRAPGSVSSIFYVRTVQGTSVGPFSLAQMLELVATGRIRCDSLVSMDGAEPRPLSQVPTLAKLASRPAFDFSRGDTAQRAWRERIERATLPSRLYELVLGEHSGLLVLKSSRQQKRVYFTRGVPTFISSTDRGELLGARLIQSGAVSKAAIEFALANPTASGQERLGEALVARGLLKPTALLRALIEQLEARFIEMGSWNQGELCFYIGEQSGEDQLKSQTGGAVLVTRLIYESYTDGELAELLGRVRSQPIRHVPNARDIKQFGLAEAEQRVLERVQSAPSLERLIAQLAGSGVATPQQTLRAIFIGLSSGILVASGWQATG